MIGGLAVALAAQKQLRRGASMWRSPYFPGLLAYQLLVLFPAAAVLAARYPEWSLLYLWKPASLNHLWLIALSLAAGLLLSAVGYLLGAQATRKRDSKSAIIMILLLAAGLGGFVFLTGQRWWRVATEAGQQKAPTLSEVPEGLFLVLAVPVMLGGLVYLLALFAVEGKKIERASRKIVVPIAQLASSPYSSAATSPSGRGIISLSELEKLAAAAAALPPAAGEQPPVSEQQNSSPDTKRKD